MLKRKPRFFCERTLMARLNKKRPIAITYDQRVDPDRLVLVYDWSDEKQKWIAVCVAVEQQVERIIVLTMGTFDTVVECKDWFQRMKIEQPWAEE